MQRLIDLSIVAPRRAIALVLGLTALIACGAIFLRFDFSPQQMYGGNTDVVEFSERHKELFRFEDSIAYVLLESTSGETLLREESLAWMRRLSDGARNLENVTDVSSLVTLETPRANLREGDLRWMPLLPERFDAENEWLADRLDRLPLLNDLLISHDRLVTLTLITLDPSGRDIDNTRRSMTGIRELVSTLGTPKGTRVLISGVPAIRVDIIRSLIDDQWVMTPISGCLFLVISLFMYRSWQVTLIALTTVVAAVGLLMGIMGWSGMTFSLLSNVVPTLVLIIGAANCVHIIGRLVVVLREEAQPTASCVRIVMREMSWTCLLTLTTTAIGFGSLLMAESDMLRALALQAALGMLCNYVCLMLVLAPGLTLTGHLLRRTDKHGDAVTSSGIWDHVGRFVCRYPVPIVTVHLCAGAAAVFAATRIPVNSYMFETYDADHPVVQVTELLDNRMSGLISLEVQLAAPDRDAFFSPEMARACETIRNELRKDDRITFTRDHIELLSAFDKRVVSEDRETQESALARVQRLIPKINRPEVTRAFLAEDIPRARMMLRVRDLGSRGFRELFADIESVLARELPDGTTFQLTGDAWLHTICMDQFVRDLFYSLLAASGIIFVLIGILFRSVRAGLVSSIPNLFPLAMTLGYMYLRGYELTAGNVIVFAISLGIAVDDTIHFLARYRDELNDNVDTRVAITAALRSSGRAIVLTSFLIVSGLSVLVFSEFLPTRRFAELTAITMCAALPGDVILLPAMLCLLSRWRTRDQPKNAAGPFRLRRLRSPAGSSGLAAIGKRGTPANLE